MSSSMKQQQMPKIQESKQPEDSEKKKQPEIYKYVKKFVSESLEKSEQR